MPQVSPNPSNVLQTLPPQSRPNHDCVFCSNTKIWRQGHSVKQTLTKWQKYRDYCVGREVTDGSVSKDFQQSTYSVDPTKWVSPSMGNQECLCPDVLEQPGAFRNHQPGFRCFAALHQSSVIEGSYIIECSFVPKTVFCHCRYLIQTVGLLPGKESSQEFYLLTIPIR